MDDALDRFKFRIWDKKRKVMLTEDNCYEEDDHYEHDEWWGAVTSLTITAISSLLECYNKDNLFVIMQCVGIKDKNGTFFYEGDIVENLNSGNRFEVVWFKSGFILRDIDNGTELAFDKFEAEWLEIVGNRYENPELLNK